jgi:hypothetical protein
MTTKISRVIKHYRGTSIGILFAVFSVISLFILVPSYLAAFFAGTIEMMSSIFIGSEPYHSLATFTIYVLLVLFILGNMFLIRFIKYNEITKGTLFLVYVIFY